jgi:hypothetical protein
MVRILVSLALAAACWGGAVSVSSGSRRDRVEKPELFYYPSGQFLRQATMGYDQAASSLAWIRTVQYYGEHAKGDRRFDMLYHLCDVTTDLDPHFEEPYTFGSFILLTEGKRPSAGMDLLAKGRRENPQSWRIFFETGFTYYIAWENYREAARYFTEAARMPGAPEYAARFAAWVSYRAGETRTSLLLWQELAERTTNPQIREKALKKVQELTARLSESPDAPRR